MHDYKFGNMLRELREKCGLSQYQMGQLVGVTNRAVSKWETGSAKPKTELLLRLAEVLQVPLETLLNGSPEPLYVESIMYQKKFCKHAFCGRNRKFRQTTGKSWNLF